MKRNHFWAAAATALSLAASPLLRAQEQLALAGDTPVAKLASLQNALKDQGAKWVAEETEVSRLTAVQSKMRFGLSFAPIKAPPLPEPTEAAAAILPRNFDWRDNHGVSGIRDQKACGSCWAFAMTQALESNVMIESKSSDDVSLSEQVMISCSGKGSCDGGVINADFLQTTGLPPASDYPYTATDGSCDTAKAGWKHRAFKIGGWNRVGTNLMSIKSALATYGPLPTSLMAMEDLMYYKSGVYSYAQGKSLGGHAVLLVGYNDDGQYFIVKNSWGPAWGEGGFFRIAYSQMNNSVAFGGSTIVYTPTPKSRAAAPDVALSAAAPSRAASSDRDLSPKAVYQKAGPAVVLIMGADSDGSGELGTGSVINDSGQILTNAHVVIHDTTKEPFEKIRVYFKPVHITGDAKKDLVTPYEATVASFDRSLDLAVLNLKVKPAALTFLPLGDSGAVEAGERVVAIGHPEQGGLWTLTQGVVSTVVSNLGGVEGKDAFQTDASINRGNSGGPLIDRQGALIGVNTSMARKASDGLTITSVNFSIKSGVVKTWLASAGLAGRYTVLDSGPDSPLSAAPETASPSPAAKAPPEGKAAAVVQAPAAAKAKPVILTPQKPFKIEDLIRQQIAEMEDLEKDMQGEIDQRREQINSQK